jgi:hypothetical protein
MVRLIDFGPEDRYFFRGLDSDLNGIAVDPSDFYVNVIADYDSFIHFS